jgi:hypothetical protein
MGVARHDLSKTESRKTALVRKCVDSDLTYNQETPSAEGREVPRGRCRAKQYALASCIREEKPGEVGKYSSELLGHKPTSKTHLEEYS